MDGRQFAHAELEARAGPHPGDAAVAEPDERRWRRNGRIGSRREEQKRTDLMQYETIVSNTRQEEADAFLIHDM